MNRFAALMEEEEDDETPATHYGTMNENVNEDEQEWNEMIAWADEDPHGYYNTTKEEWEAIRLPELTESEKWIEEGKQHGKELTKAEQQLAREKAIKQITGQRSDNVARGHTAQTARKEEAQEDVTKATKLLARKKKEEANEIKKEVIEITKQLAAE